MIDAFKSFLLFFRANKGAGALLTITLSLLFFVCLVLHALTSVAIVEAESSKAYTSLYTITYLPADQSLTESVVEATYKADQSVDALNIYGQVALQTKEGGETSLPLIGFDGTKKIPIGIYRGTATLIGDDVLVDEWSYSQASLCIKTDAKGNEYLMLKNGESRHIAGVVFMQGILDYVGVDVKRDQFFSMTDNSTSMQVAFSEPLSPEAEERWLTEVSKLVELSGVDYPDKNLKPIQQESAVQTILSRIVIVVILLSSMRVMSYLFLLRKQEFAVMRMLGADRNRIEGYILAMLFAVAAVSEMIGTIGYKFLVSFPSIREFLPSLPPTFIWSDVVFFLIATLCSGFVMFLYSQKTNVARMNEEV